MTLPSWLDACPVSSNSPASISEPFTDSVALLEAAISIVVVLSVVPSDSPQPFTGFSNQSLWLKFAMSCCRAITPRSTSVWISSADFSSALMAIVSSGS